MNKSTILNISLDDRVNKQNYRECFFKLLNSGNSKIFTVNPEFIVDAYFDSSFKRLLNKSDLNTIDGFGVALFLKLKNLQSSGTSLFSIFNLYKKGQIRSNILTGVELVDITLRIMNEEKLSLFLLGGSSKQNISKLAAKQIERKYPNIKIIGFSSEFSFSSKDDSQTIKYIHQKMKEKSCKRIDVILVGYGHKKQEAWISRNSSKIPANISIGVGGTLDFLSGNISRAPKLIRDLGLEWLYRLVMQPSRFPRILKAVILFPILVAFFDNKKATHN
jgi:N-acetylglucosaminyldiphosphoundecaprenol N-acetyl-beta-D-mannosaminyltransferase